MSTSPLELAIIAGPDAGRRFTVAPTGARIGRSSANDVELKDPSLSRFHCRLFYAPDGGLRVSDLGSTNETTVNGKPIVEQALVPGDVIELGETQIRVVAAGASAEPAVIDLGLGAVPPALAPDAAPPRKAGGWIAVLLIAAALVAAGAYVVVRPQGPSAEPADTAPAIFEFSYEKVQASADEIFRYALALRGNRLSARVDSLAGGRHDERAQDVDPSLLDALRRDMEQSGFFDLDSAYQGVAPASYDLIDLALTAGSRTHRVRALNRIPPPALAKARDIIETFARSELGLAAVSLPPDQLIALARDAVLQGQKLFGEREVRYGNLAGAIRSFEEAQWYLETIEPKPDFYGDAVSGLEEAKRLLDERVESYRFQADRAIKLRDWEEAANALRVVCEMVPDRGDERHQHAARTLLDVERRIQR